MRCVAPCITVWTSINSALSIESRRRDPVVTLTSLTTTWLVLTPAAADTAAINACLTVLFGALKLEAVVLSVTTAVMILVYEHTKPFSHRQWRIDELPSTDTVCVGHALMLVEF